MDTTTTPTVADWKLQQELDLASIRRIADRIEMLFPASYTTGASND